MVKEKFIFYLREEAKRVLASLINGVTDIPKAYNREAVQIFVPKNPKIKYKIIVHIFPLQMLK